MKRTRKDKEHAKKLVRLIRKKFAEEVILCGLSDRDCNSWEFLEIFRQKNNYYHDTEKTFSVQSFVKTCHTNNRIDKVLAAKTSIIKHIRLENYSFGDVVLRNHYYDIKEEVKLLAANFVKCTTPFGQTVTWHYKLEKYFVGLEKIYGVKPNNFKYSKYLPKPKFFEENFSFIKNKSICITTLSMGKESLWNLVSLVYGKKYEKIIAVHVQEMNYGSSYREKQKLIEFIEKVKKKKEFCVVKFVVIKYDSDLLSIAKNEKFIKINDLPIKEPLTKMQWLQLMMSEIIIREAVGVVVIPMDFKEVSYNYKSHYGDQPISFILFGQYLDELIGPTTLSLRGLDLTRENKILYLKNLGFLEFTSSCYMNWNYFLKFQQLNQLNPNLNMCGSCFKCKEDIEIYKSLNLL